MDDSMISTYYNFSIVEKGEKSSLENLQIINNNKNTYVFDVDAKNDMLVYNTYNTKDFEIVLTKDNSLLSIKNDIKMNLDFYNADIEEITFDKDSEAPVIMIKYADGEVFAVNYYNGELLFESRDTKTSLFSYINKRFFNTNKVTSTMNDSYDENSNLVNVALKADNDKSKE